MPALIQLVGRTFGRWTVLERAAAVGLWSSGRAKTPRCWSWSS